MSVVTRVSVPGALPDTLQMHRDTGREADKACAHEKRTQTIGRLRRLVERLEGRHQRFDSSVSCEPSKASRSSKSPSGCWSLGAEDLDSRIGDAGLDVCGVHEIKPSQDASNESWAGASIAAVGFALALCARHRVAVDRHIADLPVAFCQSGSMTRELGQVYPWGLSQYALAPSDLLLVEPRRADDVLWAAEECLRSGGVRCLIARVRDVDLTSARRLALAAAEHATPCLLLSDTRAPVTAATATRWCVGPDPGAADPFDAEAPGARRFSVVLDRCRARPFAAQPGSFALEWCDETFCFRLVAGLRHRASPADVAAGDVIAGPFRATAKRRSGRARAA